jgi:hypothetical protein
MPPQRPDYFTEGVYHIYNRGSHRASIFREPDNYLFVLRKIKNTCLNSNFTAYLL